jgi:anti-sigma B factor antagonist
LLYFHILSSAVAKLEREMNLFDEAHDGVLVVRVQDTRIDASRAPGFKGEITRRVEAGQTKLVLDLTLVEFIDSVGLGALVSCFKRVGSRGKLVIVGAKGAVSRLFSLTRMDRVFPLAPTVEEAVSQASGVSQQ